MVPVSDTSAPDAGPKAYQRGTHRTEDPEETLARTLPLRSRLGITRVANVTGLDRLGLPVVMVCRPNSRSVAVAQGKGIDLASAKASGVMEALETWHAERVSLPLRLASCEELAAAHPCVEVETLAAVRGSRYRPDLRMLWIEGRDLASGAPLWLPYEMVHTDYRLPLPPGHGCFAASSNGLASGNHPLEAACHAICEVIERDATTLWHQRPAAQRARTRLDLGTVEDATCAELLGTVARAGLSVAAWSTTSDVGVPAFYCMLTDGADPVAHVGAGAGCHPVREIALLRALTEAAQVRLTYIAGSRDDLSWSEYTRAGIAQKRDAALALAAAGEPACDFRGLPTHPADTFAADLAWLLARLEAAGAPTVAAVDLTRPAIGVPVIRVVIPGLEAPHDDETYLPGPRARTMAAGGP